MPHSGGLIQMVLCIYRFHTGACTPRYLIWCTVSVTTPGPKSASLAACVHMSCGLGSLNNNSLLGYIQLAVDYAPYCRRTWVRRLGGR